MYKVQTLLKHTWQAWAQREWGWWAGIIRGWKKLAITSPPPPSNWLKMLHLHIILLCVCKDHLICLFYNVCLYLRSTQVPVCKVHLVSLAVMDITGYQAVTVEMAQKVRRAWLVHLGHVVLKETQDKMVQTLTTETGNNVRGRVRTAVTLVLSK